MLSFKEELVISTKQILAEEADSIVIRDFATSEECTQLTSETDSDTTSLCKDVDITQLYDLFPVLHDVDELVKKWSETDETYGYTALSGIAYAVERSRGIRPHVDGPTIEDDGSHRLYGPITASLRVDSATAVERRVTINAWPSTDACLKNGTTTDQYIHFEPNRRRLFAERFRLWPTSYSIIQNPGDLVLFRGHPRPVRHAIAQHGRTQQIVFGYQLQGNGNAEQALEILRRQEYDQSPRTRWGTCHWPI